jgi:hypothetical protein
MRYAFPPYGPMGLFLVLCMRLLDHAGEKRRDGNMSKEKMDNCLKGTYIVAPIEYAVDAVQCQVCGTKCKPVSGEVADGLVKFLLERENKEYRVYYHD